MKSRAAKRKLRAERFCKHLTRFVDRHRFPSFVLTSEAVVAEAKRQSHGEGKLSPHEKQLIEPLRDAQRCKEINLNGLIDEMQEWQRNGWGWGYPWLSEFERLRDDWIMRKALLEIRKQFVT